MCCAWRSRGAAFVICPLCSAWQVTRLPLCTRVPVSSRSDSIAWPSYISIELSFWSAISALSGVSRHLFTPHRKSHKRCVSVMGDRCICALYDVFKQARAQIHTIAHRFFDAFNIVVVMSEPNWFICLGSVPGVLAYTSPCVSFIATRKLPT